ncbi:MAG: HEPN domain-containing protein [Methylophilaceae bacterium]|nr:HEPN domain-containing protein [Methylophilaceae bacterium]
MNTRRGGYPNQSTSRSALKIMTGSSLGHAALKQRHRLVRDGHSTSLRLRIHRALSWLNRAEQAKDMDSRFIFLWIAFNAAYAQELEESNSTSDKTTFTAFLKKLCNLDTSQRIEKLIWNEFSNSIRVLLDNPYVFHPFWEFQRGRIDDGKWEALFTSAKKSAQTALSSGNTPALLSMIFNRLYTLRNQLFHGGATWDGKLNRNQLRDCTRLLGKLVPVIIALMMDNPDTLWGDAVYPVVEQDT